MKENTNTDARKAAKEILFKKLGVIRNGQPTVVSPVEAVINVMIEFAQSRPATLDKGGVSDCGSCKGKGNHGEIPKYGTDICEVCDGTGKIKKKKSLSEQPEVKGDMLRMDYINSLPQPLYVEFGANATQWPVYDIDVQSGLFRIDVMGKLESHHFGEVTKVMDEEGNYHDPDSFYSDYKPTESEKVERLKTALERIANRTKNDDLFESDREIALKALNSLKQ